MQENMSAPESNSKIPFETIKASTMEPRNHSIPDFLNRLYTIDNFQWAKTDAKGSVLKTYRFPDVLLSNPAIFAKIRNFYGFRAGVEFIVLVNKQQFQQGNLLISYLPNAKYNPAKLAMHSSNLQGIVCRSGAPRVNLDLMDATRADLRVPYASPFVYYNLLTKEGTIGDFQISVYSGLQDVASAGTVSVQVMARFIDVDLEFPTGAVPATFGALSGFRTAAEELISMPDRNRLEETRKEINKMLKLIDAGKFTFQMNSTSTSAFKQKALPNMATSNDPNQTHMLSISSNNSLPSANIGEASISEMSMAKPLSIFCYHDAFTISNQGTNVNVWNKVVTPQIAANITNADGSFSVDYLYWLSEMFKKWRGSINFNFRAVKTTFHSARIRVWFSPGSTTLANIDRNSVISKIIDLKDRNNFSFEVPYIHPYPQLNTKTGTTSLGIIGVDIINRMVYPSTVSDSIEIIVERAAGPDFSFNLPSAWSKFPFDPTPSTLRKLEMVRGAPAQPIAQPVAIPQPDLAPVQPIVQPDTAPQPDIVQDLPITNDFIKNMKNLPQALIQELRGAIVRAPEKFKQPNITALNQLASYETVTQPMLTMKLPDILTRIDHYQNSLNPEKDGPGHHVELRALPGNQLFMRRKREADFEKDLTTEGIEPNPGPTKVISNFISAVSTTPKTITSDWYGPQQISLVIIPSSGLAFANVNMTGDLTGNLVLNSSIASRIVKFTYAGSAKPSITFTAPTPAEFTTNTGVIFQVKFTNTASEWSFQSGSEQDSIRNGYQDTDYTRPMQCQQIDSLCLGQSIPNINQLLHRSTLFGVVDVTQPLPIHIQTHAIGIAKKDAANNVVYQGIDNLSYLSSAYAFARGGINLRLVSTGAPFVAMVDPGNDINQTTTQTFNLAELSASPLSTVDTFKSSNLMQQAINTSVEGFGEISVPFFSSSYCYSISPQLQYQPSKSVTDFTLPDTQSLIVPQGNLSKMEIYRATTSDFELSYLTGPPLLISIT